jgi:hypothetical protein
MTAVSNPFRSGHFLQGCNASDYGGRSRVSNPFRSGHFLQGVKEVLVDDGLEVSNPFRSGHFLQAPLIRPFLNRRAGCHSPHGPAIPFGVLVVRIWPN